MWAGPVRGERSPCAAAMMPAFGRFIYAAGNRPGDLRRLSHQETRGIGPNVVERPPAKIVGANSAGGVEVVSGISVTSNALCRWV